MNKRTTFSLDEGTVESIRKLAALFRISQAEVVRRAIALSEREAYKEQTDALDRLNAYHEQGGIAAEQVEEYLGQVQEDRSSWGRHW